MLELELQIQGLEVEGLVSMVALSGTQALAQTEWSYCSGAVQMGTPEPLDRAWLGREKVRRLGGNHARLGHSVLLEMNPVLFVALESTVPLGQIFAKAVLPILSQ